MKKIKELKVPVAKNEHGELMVALFSEKGENYYCLECGGIVELRKGDKNISHFARTNCECFSDPFKKTTTKNSFEVKIGVDRAFKTQTVIYIREYVCSDNHRLVEERVTTIAVNDCLKVKEGKFIINNEITVFTDVSYIDDDITTRLALHISFDCRGNQQTCNIVFQEDYEELKLKAFENSRLLTERQRILLETEILEKQIEKERIDLENYMNEQIENEKIRRNLEKIRLQKQSEEEAILEMKKLYESEGFESLYEKYGKKINGDDKLIFRLSRWYGSKGDEEQQSQINRKVLKLNDL